MYYFGNLNLTCVAFGFTAWDEAGALGAGAGVASRSEQTQVAADSLTWIHHCSNK